MSGKHIRIAETDLHPHLKARMEQRGVTRREIELTLNDGWRAADAKSGTLGKVKVFPYHAEWEGRFYEEKEVTVYYRGRSGGAPALLTVKTRYGRDFAKGEQR